MKKNVAGFLCNVTASSWKKAFAFLQLEWPDVVQYGLTPVKYPPVVAEKAQQTIVVENAHDDRAPGKQRAIVFF